MTGGPNRSLVTIDFQPWGREKTWRVGGGGIKIQEIGINSSDYKAVQGEKGPQSVEVPVDLGKKMLPLCFFLLIPIIPGK